MQQTIDGIIDLTGKTEEQMEAILSAAIPDAIEQMRSFFEKHEPLKGVIEMPEIKVGMRVQVDAGTAPTPSGVCLIVGIVVHVYDSGQFRLDAFEPYFGYNIFGPNQVKQIWFN